MTSLIIVYTYVCLSDVPSETSDFFPLSVTYQERFSAAGRTRGGFFKREGKTKDNEVRHPTAQTIALITIIVTFLFQIRSFINRNCEIKSIVPYGVFVEIAPGREAVKVGDRVDVKLIEVNDKGQLRLSRRALLPVPQTSPEDPSSKQLTSNQAEVVVADSETSLLARKKVFKIVKKSGGKAVTGVSGKDGE
ncbi:hypothetical protein F3Y22_tig00000205pilonHSYRG00069 [Hibiscus syriacus]|uniref:S1 motif domain-containing protein n=1 Tax=Hibiscus syriacus TaxID=106335 RepID=A0A6A3D5X6_HIBSY|nr:hypothetical protein F3Y22_tig00000205pilonHSYRG00069 [Hibiscus syriacus]